jgi:hypothetical protein
MGNSSSKDSHRERHRDQREPAPSNASPQLTPQQIASERLASQIYGARVRQGNGRESARGSRHDLSFLGIGRERPGEEASERPRETKQERDARKAEKERLVRVKDRERSMRDESVDGGYLVTVGVYTGVEDFSKPVVRQLQVRLATDGTFWTQSLTELPRSKDGWLRSGEVWMITQILGLSISLLLLREVFRFLPQTRFQPI